MTVLVGSLIGLVSFWLAMAAVPFKHIDSFSEHDLFLARNLAYIFPPLIGIWTGFCRRSLSWILVGICLSPLLGWLYKVSCGEAFDILLIAAAVPCLLGGIAAVALGYGRTSWRDGLLLRLIKGSLSGFILGFVYEVVLNVACAVLQFAAPANLADPTFGHFRLMMWLAVSVAMAIGGSIFLPLFHWSANVPAPQFRMCGVREGSGDSTSDERNTRL